MSVAEIENTFSYSEIQEWGVYFSIYPFSEVRADYRMGVLAAQQYNLNRGKHKAKSPDYFMPKFGQSRKEAKKDFVELVKANQRDIKQAYRNR